MMIQEADDSFRNNIIAQSDYQAALKALETTFQDIDETDPIARDLFQAAHASLVSNLSRMVQPVEDSVYHASIDPYHVVEEDESDQEEEEEVVDQQDEEIDEQDEEIDEQDEEIDEEDLLDTKALKEAQQLRSQVRNLSQRVQQIRDRVLQKVESSSSSSQPQPDVRVQIEGAEQEKSDADLTSSLEGLSKLLNHSQWAKLPQHLQSLQDTIEVIHKENVRPLSQTDVAIISRNNSEDEGLHMSSQDDQDLSAPDRLLRFFQDLA
jgi:hypothetical protein